MTPPSPQETRRLIAVSCGIQVGPRVQRSHPVSRGFCATQSCAPSSFADRTATIASRVHHHHAPAKNVNPPRPPPAPPPYPNGQPMLYVHSTHQSVFTVFSLCVLGPAPGRDASTQVEIRAHFLIIPNYKSTCYKVGTAKAKAYCTSFDLASLRYLQPINMYNRTTSPCTLRARRARVPAAYPLSYLRAAKRQNSNRRLAQP